MVFITRSITLTAVLMKPRGRGRTGRGKIVKEQMVC
jgi:hypothetical protein